eukprot:TRINITY_DN3742_c0_g1_i1.p5 TRINITY_DN3742_c0_g1~~TRINITY_DN3742_c0_g1_i1.p5  ORF type:complete len:53 (+),score=24.56 TRINITY_DN3742_c0_g1_i1:641-799(+)
MNNDEHNGMNDNMKADKVEIRKAREQRALLRQKRKSPTDVARSSETAKAHRG